MNDAEEGKIKARIAAMEREEARILRDLRAVRGEAETGERMKDG